MGRSAACRLSPISPELSPTWSVLPMPSAPSPLPPQQATLKSLSSAQVWLYPALMLEAFFPLPRSTVGRLSPISPLESPVFPEPVPNPVLPIPLLPQHRTLPLSRIAQVCECPAEIWTAVLSSPRSTAGRPSPILARHSLSVGSFKVGWHWIPSSSP